TLTAGNLLVVLAYGGQGPGQSSPPTSLPNMTFAVSDTLGNVFSPGPMIENPISHQSALQFFYAANIKGGTDTITVTSASPSQSISLWTGALVQEYAGAALTDVVDVSVARSANQSTDKPSAGPMMTRSPCDLVVGAFVDGHVSGQKLSAL